MSTYTGDEYSEDEAASSVDDSGSLDIDDLDLPSDVLREYEEVFKTYDENKNGKISARELKNVMRRLGHELSAADIQKMVQMGDKNSDGEVSFPEFCHMMTYVHTLQVRAVVEAFHIFDADQSGFIDKDELSRAMTALGRPMTDDQLDEMIAEADADDDGQISLQEFCAMNGIDEEVDGDIFADLSSEELSTTSEASYESSVDEGKLQLDVRAFYLDERPKIQVDMSVDTVSSLAKKIGKAVGHPSELLRLYHQGFHLEPRSRRLSKFKFSSRHNTVFYIYLPLPDPLSSSKCFSHGTPDLDNMYHHFQREGLIKRSDANKIMKAAAELFRSENNLVHVNDPCVVVGDIHGQFFDLDLIFSSGGPFSPDKTYLFLGDYVDRGYFSCEVILYLFAAKVRYPDRVYLLRGNHESRKTTKKYGTQHECEAKYGKKFYKDLMKCFDHLPLYALLHTAGKRILMMHGGLSQKIDRLSQIEDIHRAREPPVRGALKDCLWTDPYKDCERDDEETRLVWDLNNLEKHDREMKTTKRFVQKQFHKSIRGPTVASFGHPAICSFLQQNGLLAIFRAHEQKQEGFQYYKDGPTYKFPSCVTLFSAPNYTDKSMNNGSIAIFDGGRLEIVPYSWRLHPIYHPHTSKHHPNEKDLTKEDFLQFVHNLQPGSIARLPLFRLEKEYREMFLDQRHADVDSLSYDTGGSEDNFAADAWGHVNQNLLEVLKLSDDPNIRKLYKKRARAMLLWYDGYDHFSEAVDSESEYEMDFQDPAESEDYFEESSEVTGASSGGCCSNCTIM